ncbi:MAG TPA: hypothetical protein ENI37_03605, partial [Chloroflexi bacterium]|nr:hypothetical protein [Chloroflexota bacterium]
LFLLGLLGLAVAYEAWCADRIYPGVRVWGLPVGGARLVEAAAALETHLTVLGQPVFTLRGPGRSWGVRPTDLGVRLAAEATARAAFRIGRGAGDGLPAHLLLLLWGQDLPPVLSYDEATARLYLETLAEQVDQPPVDAALTLQDTTPVASPARPGRALDVEATLAAVREGLASLGTGGVNLVVREVPPQVTDAEPARAWAQALLAESLVLVSPDPREGDPGPWVLPPEQLADLLSTFVSNGRLQATLDRERLRAYLEGLAPTLAVAAVNARFHFDEASGELVPVAPSAEGRALDVEGSLQNVLAAVEAGQHTAPLSVQAVTPRYTEAATAEELDIRVLVAEGDSYFIGSPSGRDHNIRLAASKFDGLVIAPGETFSFNHYLGEVSAEVGYDESYITAGEQLAVEVGGGICQVSTTAFRAALRGGYPIVERWFHHHRVGYYELRGYGPGFDATVYSPLVDLKFVNDRSAPLLIETEIEERTHRLVFRFYSTDDGRRVEVEGAEITDEIEPGEPIYQLDETLEPGTVIRWQSALAGLTATVERWVYDAAGNLMYHDTFVSHYAPRRAAYHYGPGYEPPEEGTGDR